MTCLRLIAAVAAGGSTCQNNLNNLRHGMNSLRYQHDQGAKLWNAVDNSFRAASNNFIMIVGTKNALALPVIPVCSRLCDIVCLFVFYDNL